MSNNIPKAIAFSPITTLTKSLAIDGDKAYPYDINAFADLAAGEIGIITFCDKPNLISFDPADFETATYTGKGTDGDGDFLSGIVRGVEGDARVWGVNTYMSSYSSAYAWNIIRDRITNHEEATEVHSATEAATPLRLIIRDSEGRAKVVDGSDSADIATKGQVDAKPDLGELETDAYRGDRGVTAYDHSQDNTGAVHGASSTKVANMLVRRDSVGRARIESPSNTEDITNKQYVDNLVAAKTGHRGASTFNSTTGRTVTIGVTLANTNYRVAITPTANTGGLLGEYWVAEKTTTNFKVFNTGSNNSASFDWMLIAD